MTSLINKLGWSSVAAITADGERYADYMSSLQDILHYDKVTFKRFLHRMWFALYPRSVKRR